jgi:hypothetical protein
MRFSIDENMFSNSVRTGIDGQPEIYIDDLISYIDLTESIGALIVERPNK